jgi:CheY-like chemotaxis protein
VNTIANPPHLHQSISDQAGHILVVDDEDDIRDLVCRVLRELGFSVWEAADGEQALAQLTRVQTLHLILCNLRMPYVSGPMLYRRVAEASPALASRFVFCSGDLVSEQSRRFLDEVGCPCLEKPFELESLEVLARQYSLKSPVRVDRATINRLVAGSWQREERRPARIRAVGG